MFFGLYDIPEGDKKTYAMIQRADTVGVFQQLRQAVLAELTERTGRDLDDVLLMGATHTHSGPGRVIDGGGPYDLIADRFFPEFYERMVQRIADTVEAAIADQRPARLGFAEIDIAAAHEDRRCEDGLDYTNDRTPIVAVEREGTIDALMLSYAIHGTVLGIDDLTLSQDVSGAIEHGIAQTFDHPVQVSMFNSWGADVSPGKPDVPLQSGANLPGGYQQMDEVGFEVARAVSEAIDQMTWEADPELWMKTYRVGIDRQLLEYDASVFPFDYGGVYCSVNEELVDCDPETDLRDEGLDKSCVGFPADYPAPTQTVFSAGQLGPFSMMTFPGEPGTLLAESLMDTLRQDESVQSVLFMGYAQDYIGYSILEDDWWQGGYEASGALWGPRQGAYLSDRAAEAFQAARLDEAPLFDQPAPVPPFEVGTYTPYTPTPPVDLGAILLDVADTVEVEDVVTFTVAGSDPWLGTPQAILLDEDGVEVTYDSGHPFESHSMGWWIDLEPTPSYSEDKDSASRRFDWTVSLPVQRQVNGVSPVLSGRYQIEVRVPTAEREEVVRSAMFSVVREE